jgi:hypothetical protein
VRCQSEALAHHVSTLTAARRAVNHVHPRETPRSSDQWVPGIITLIGRG